MSVTPKISVIIPCFNYGHYISATLESIIKQTFTNWECIVINDGSTDNSLEVIERIIEGESRIRCINTSNGGQARARNIGIRSSTGEYIQFLDADDLLQKDKLLNQVNYLKNNYNVDIVYSCIRYFQASEPDVFLFSRDGKNTNNFPYMSGKGHEILDFFLYQNPIELGAMLFRKQVFINQSVFFDESLNGAEDWEVVFKLALVNSTFAFVGFLQSSILMRYHSQSYSTISPTATSAYFTLKERMLQLIMNVQALNLLKDKNKALTFFGKYMITLLHNKKYFRALYYLFKLIQKTRQYRFYLSLYLRNLQNSEANKLLVESL